MARFDFPRIRASVRQWSVVASLATIFTASVHASNFAFVGNASFLIDAPNVTLTVDSIDSIPPYPNQEITGNIRLELWAFPSPYSGSLAAGHKAGQYFWGNLPIGWETPKIVATVAFTPPPDGVWYFTMLITESEDGVTANGGFVPRAFRNFSDAITFGPPLPPDMAFAIEYFHSGFGHYFVTSQSDEIVGLDTGVFAGWARTGQTFKVWTEGAGLADLCRFFTEFFAPKSSHFYTAIASECESVKQDPVWQYEKIAAKVALPIAGACSTGIPLYRLYNDGKTGAPNHRYTTSTTVRAEMIAQGFIPEDANTVCVPH